MASLEEARYAAEISRDLLRRNPDLVGLFVAGGGVRGVTHVLQEGQLFGQIATIGLDLTSATRAGLIDGVLKLVIAHPLERFAEAAIRTMTQATDREGELAAAQQVILPFELYTPENV